MSKPDIFYIEFFGDPSGDKECYKRYSSKNLPFNPVGNDAEVLQLVEKKKFDEAVKHLKNMMHFIDERVSYMGDPYITQASEAQEFLDGQK